MLSVNNLKVIYQNVILGVSDVTLRVPAGGIVALLGANGAGKSTTLRAISSLLNSMDGEIINGNIEYEGKSLLGIGTRDIVRKGIVQVIEGRKILPHMTVEQNLLVGANGLKGRKERQERLAYVYDLFPKLPQLKHTSSGYLSGGEQQMMLFGRALMAKPKLVLLDEPSLGLAPLIVKQLFELVKKLAQEEGMSFLLVEQNVHIALKTADYGYIMRNGHITREGAAEELRRDENLTDYYLG